MSEAQKPEQMDFANGKYTVINSNGQLTALRHGEAWERDLVGDNLVYWMFVKAREQAAEIEALRAERDALRADAARYRWLHENRSYHYSMQPDSPAECGVEYQWQQGSYEERGWGLSEAIDNEIQRAAIDAAKEQQA